MINETVILLVRLEDCSQHKLAEHLHGYLKLNTPLSLYYYEPIKKIFSNVIAYDYTKKMTQIGVKAVNKEVIKLVKKYHSKYVLWGADHYEFQESTFDTIRENGSVVIGWFGDDEYRFNDYSKWWIPYLDYCVTFVPEVVPKYRALGAKVIYTLNSIGVPLDRNWSKIEEKYDVTFVGERNSDREQYINEIKKRNISLSVFGRGWGGYIPYEETIDIYKTSKINLNLARAGNSNRMGIKGRVFEICLAGGFLLTEYALGIEKYFDIDKELVCFHSTEELIDKVNYYLSHDIERRAIAQAGWKRAIASGYTSYDMVARIFAKIEKDPASRTREAKPILPELKMPAHVRRKFSDYYLEWGRAFLLENYKGLWRDALALSVLYNPSNTQAWCFYLSGFLPSHGLRLGSIGLARTVTRLFWKLYNKLLCWADSVPYLRDIKRSIGRKLLHTLKLPVSVPSEREVVNDDR